MATAVQLELPHAPSILGAVADQAFVMVHHRTNNLVNVLQSSRLTTNHVYVVFQRGLDDLPQRITGMAFTATNPMAVPPTVPLIRKFAGKWVCFLQIETV